MQPWPQALLKGGCMQSNIFCKLPPDLGNVYSIQSKHAQELVKTM